MPFVLIAAVVAGVLLIELALRVARPLRDPHEQAKREVRALHPYVPRAHPANYRAAIAVEGMPSLSAEGTFVANSLGMRSPEVARAKPHGTLRVVLLGSSSIECRYLDEPLTVRARLEAKLGERSGGPVEVVFAGGWAARTYDYLAMLVHRVFHLAPDVLIVPTGLTDLFAGVGGTDYLLPPRSEPDVGRRSARQLIAMLITESQIGRLAHRVLRRPVPSQPVHRLTPTEHIEWWYKGEPRPDQQRAVRTDLVSYRENLISIIGLAAAHRVALVLCTQPTVFAQPRPELGADPWFWIKGCAYRRSEIAGAMAQYNEATRAVAREHGIRLCDFAELLDRRRELFYDDSHFGADGAEAVADALADFLAGDLARRYSAVNPAAMYSATQR